MKNVDLQNILTQHPGVAEVTIGAIPDPEPEGDLVREILVDGQVVGQIEVKSREQEG